MQEGRAGLPDSAVKSERYERGESSMMKKQKIIILLKLVYGRKLRTCLNEESNL